MEGLITKFQIGQEVWLIHNNKIVKMVINRIEITISGEEKPFLPSITIQYGDAIFGMNRIGLVTEDRVFATVEELITDLREGEKIEK